ncbi:MAG TPA: hypothetical protein IAA62_01575 [Candidatus Caccopulliclostridium gallistercoris]|uniref:Uncharacterized protein n=1 Tax=Candidatus Caccopulliclostridium gallistercoris TaxID=2840719 RepID=A0A9D1NDQ3_9FIRM|nr:hypothetical protein [Candidatus Caccopulliclostridium gallistercoris]
MVRRVLKKLNLTLKNIYLSCIFVQAAWWKERKVKKSQKPVISLDKNAGGGKMTLQK